MSDNPAGWQDDPTGRHDHRYWDGTEWTEHVADAGVSSVDPYDEEPASTTTTAPGPTTTPSTGPIGWAATQPEPEPEPDPEPPAPEPSITGWAVPTRPEPTPKPEPARPAWGAPAPSPDPEATPEPEPESQPTPTPAADPEPTLSWSTTPKPVDPVSPLDAPTAEPASEPTALSTAWPATPASPSAEPQADERQATEPEATGIVDAPPVAPVDLGGDKPNHPRRRRFVLLILGLLLIGGVVAAIVVLGGGEDDDPATLAANDLSDQFQDLLGGLSDDKADCLAEGIIDAIGVEEASDLDVKGNPPPEIADEVQAALSDGMETCEVGTADLRPPDDTVEDEDPGSSNDTSTDGVSDSGAVLDGDEPASDEELQGFEDLYTQAFRDSFGLTEEESRCVAKGLIDAVREGRATENEAFDGFFDYLAECNVDPERFETPPG